MNAGPEKVLFSRTSLYPLEQALTASGVPHDNQGKRKPGRKHVLDQ
jgi:hypothetical protein